MSGARVESGLRDNKDVPRDDYLDQIARNGVEIQRWSYESEGTGSVVIISEKCANSEIKVDVMRDRER